MRGRTNTISGNALFLILIAIFLLGGLTVLMMRTSEQSDASGDAEKDRIAATEVLKEGNNLKTAVDALLSRGCSETEINFHSDVMAATVFADYDNPNAPINRSCDIYAIEGTGLNYYAIPQNYVSWTYTPGYMTSADASYNVVGTPSDTSDLVWYVYGLSKGICLEINKILGIPPEASGDPSVEAVGAWWEYYKGRFRSNAAPSGIGDLAGGKHNGKTAGCATFSGHNDLYMVLIAK